MNKLISSLSGLSSSVCCSREQFWRAYPTSTTHKWQTTSSISVATHWDRSYNSVKHYHISIPQVYYRDFILFLIISMANLWNSNSRSNLTHYAYMCKCLCQLIIVTSCSHVSNSTVLSSRNFVSHVIVGDRYELHINVMGASYCIKYIWTQC